MSSENEDNTHIVNNEYDNIVEDACSHGKSDGVESEPCVDVSHATNTIDTISVREIISQKSSRIKMRKDKLEGKFRRMLEKRNEIIQDKSKCMEDIVLCEDIPDSNKVHVARLKRTKRILSDSSDEELLSAEVPKKLNDNSSDSSSPKRATTRIMSDSEDEEILENHKETFSNEDKKMNEKDVELSSHSNHALPSDLFSDSDSDSVGNKEFSDNLRHEDEHRDDDKVSAARGQRMSAKQAMENMKKIKSEMNRMIRSKDASLPYHKPAQISLKDIMSSKLKNISDTSNSIPTSLDYCQSNNNLQNDQHKEDAAEHTVDDLPYVNIDKLIAENKEIVETIHCITNTPCEDIGQSGITAGFTENNDQLEIEQVNNIIDSSENTFHLNAEQSQNFKNCSENTTHSEVEQPEKTADFSENTLRLFIEETENTDKLSEEIHVDQFLTNQVGMKNVKVQENECGKEDTDNEIKIIDENHIDNLIERLENEKDGNLTKLETNERTQRLTLNHPFDEIINLSDDTFVEVPKKLSGVELLRENFIKHSSLKTFAETQRETEKKLRNRVFDLKQSLGEIIVKRRIEEWVSRETENDAKKLDSGDEEEAECKDNMTEEEIVDEEKLDSSDSDDDTDSDSSSSSNNEDDVVEDTKDQPEKNEKKRKRLVSKSDSSDDENKIVNDNKFNDRLKSSNNIIDGEVNPNKHEINSNKDCAASPNHASFEFNLQMDTEVDDVFSPNKPFNESQLVDNQFCEIKDNINSKTEDTQNSSEVLQTEITLMDDESQTHNKTITDDSELMELCTGKFMDGLVEDVSCQKSPLKSRNINDISANSLNTQDIENSIQEKSIENLSLTQFLESESVSNKCHLNNCDKENYKPDTEIATKTNDQIFKSDSVTIRNQKGKFVIMSSEEETEEESNDDDPKNSSEKKKKLLKRKNRIISRRMALSISDDDSSIASDEPDEELKSIASDESVKDDNEVEYDSEENEVVQEEQRKLKNVKATEFFENEAELSSEDEWRGSGDEDEADLDRLEREEGDDDKFNERKMKKQLERIHMRQILDEDKREVRLLQEILLEDGDLTGRTRERKFKWKDFEWSADQTGTPDIDGSQNTEELECEAIWRKQRHEREAYLREMKLKEKSSKGGIEDELEDQITYITTKSVDCPQKESTVNKVLPSPHKNPLFVIKRTTASLSRASTSLNRLSALLESTASNSDEILMTKVDATSKSLVFEKCSPARIKDQDIMKKRKADDISPLSRSKKPCSSNSVPKTRRGLMDFMEL